MSTGGDASVVVIVSILRLNVRKLHASGVRTSTSNSVIGIPVLSIHPPEASAETCSERLPKRNPSEIAIPGHDQLPRRQANWRDPAESSSFTNAESHCSTIDPTSKAQLGSRRLTQED